MLLICIGQSAVRDHLDSQGNSERWIGRHQPHWISLLNAMKVAQGLTNAAVPGTTQIGVVKFGDGETICHTDEWKTKHTESAAE